jgi:hypothetical protein
LTAFFLLFLPQQNSYNVVAMNMKRIVYTLCAIVLCAACTPTAETVKNDCLKNADYAVIYGNTLDAYCTCVEQKLQETEKTMPLHDSIVQNATQSCAVEYTTLDTDFE